MAGNTKNLGLYFKDPLEDGNDTFNIQTMLNDNWNKLDYVLTGLSSDTNLTRFIIHKLLNYVRDSEKGAADGVATLGSDSKVPSSQLPDMDYIPTSAKGAANGVATLGPDGIIPSDQVGMRIERVTYTGTGKTGTNVSYQTQIPVSFMPKVVIIYDRAHIGYAVLVYPDGVTSSIYGAATWVNTISSTISENVGITARILYNVVNVGSTYKIRIGTDLGDAKYQFNEEGTEYTAIVIG